MDKSSQLVFQHIENMSRDMLENENYRKLIRQYVHKQSGVYALYNKNKLYYVGLASNLNSRLKHHLNDRHADTWDRFSAYLTQGDSHLREIEALILRIASPKGNRQMGKLKRSENIKKKVIADYWAMMEKQQKGLFSGKAVKGEFKKNKTSDHNNSRASTLAPYIKKRIHIRLEYKGKLYVAHVRRDGTITFGSESHRAKELQGPVYTSPSLAGKAVTGKPIDGWLVWTYKNSKGEWVKLDLLRKKS